MVILDPRLLGELKDFPDHVISQAVAVEEVYMLTFTYGLKPLSNRLLTHFYSLCSFVILDSAIALLSRILSRKI